VLWRRTKLGLLFSPVQKAHLEKYIAESLAANIFSRPKPKKTRKSKETGSSA
jgi:hypothetical protein